MDNNYILPIGYYTNNARKQIKQGEIAILIHLHYAEDVEYYFQYIRNIPDNIDIVFTVSETIAERKIIEQCQLLKREYRIIRKENRGRDISALLVAAREILLEYKYICFLHDKKSKSEKYRQDVEEWKRCLWENLLGSKELIYNIIGMLENNEKLGLLAPPAIVSENMPTAYVNVWYNNFDNAKNLAKEMELNCKLDEGVSPITIGTVFWAKTKSLAKLLYKNWRYEDFDEEPLRGDGTISHAIERILSYVAEDAGYTTGIVMSDEYAIKRLENFEYLARMSSKYMGRVMGYRNIYQLNKYDKFQQFLMSRAGNKDKIYIYGAGDFGKRVLTMYRELNILPKAFLVSDNQEKTDKALGLSVYKLSSITLDDDSVIVIAVSETKRKELYDNVKKIFPDFENIVVVDFDM